MKKYLHDIVNGVVITLGVIALSGVVFEADWNNRILFCVGVVGVLYILYSIYLLFGNRVKFDWYLLRENYILKVIALVLYTPFVLAFFYQWKAEEKISKALIFDENLYKEMPQKDVCPALSSNLPNDLRNKQEDPSLFWSIYVHYIDPGNQHMSTTPKGRMWAALIAILGVFLVNGLLVSSIIGWIDIRKEKWLKGEVKYWLLMKLRRHYVIIGGNDMVAGIVKQLFETIQREKHFFSPYILIQTNRDVETFRRELFTDLTEEQQRKVIIYYGSRTSDDDIADLALSKAKEVYILGEDTRTDDIESYHDTMNMECLKLVSEQVKNVTGYYCVKDKDNNIIEDYRLVCRVMFEYQTSFSVFQFSEISDDIKHCIQFKPFNYYEMWAQQVLINKAIDKEEILTSPYMPLEGVDGIGKDDDRYVHLIIVGMSRMGISMAIEAAHLAHYPNFDQKKIRTKITFIDKNAKEEKDFFMGRFKELFALSHWRYGAVDEQDILKWKPQNDIHIQNTYHYLGGDFLDVEWEFLHGGVENPCVQEYITASVNCQESIVTIAVCLPEPSRCLAAALYLDRGIYENVNQVLVYNRYGDSLISQMTHKTDKQMNPYYNKLRAFGMSDQCYDCRLIEEAEFIASKLNARYNKIYERVDEGVGPGKSDVAKWWSNIYSANTLWTKLRFMKWTYNDEKEKSSNQVEEVKWWSNIFPGIKHYCMKWFAKNSNKNSDNDDTNDDINKWFDDSSLNTLAKTEHARWNMEQLLLGYRPLTATEQAEFLIVDEHGKVVTDLRKKNIYKGKLAHLDICSFARLKEIDKGSIQYDRGLSSILPDIYLKLKRQADECKR